MSDFDDEATKGSDPADDSWDDEPVEEAPAARAPRRRPEPVDDDWDDDWDDDDRGGKRDLTLVYVVVAAAVVIVLAIVFTQGGDDGDSASTTGGGGTEETATESLPDKNWQGAVADAVGDQGADAQARVATAPGVYIWTDFWGWHVRNNGPDEVVVTVAADQVRTKETDDYDDEDEDGSAEFKTEEQVTIPAGDGAEGVGFDLGTSEQAIFTVTVDGEPITADLIKLGGAEGVADENPVTFTKA